MKFFSYERMFLQNVGRICAHVCNVVRRQGYQIEDPGYDFQQEHEICLVYETSGLVLGHSQPPIKWNFGVLLPTAV
jgi:hypothetical protein